MNTGFQLFQLQEIDSSIDKANLRIMKIETELGDDAHVIKAEKKIQNLEKDYLSFKAGFNSIDDEIQSRKIKKSQSESALYNGGIVNPKELQDLQKEISSLNAFIAKLEEELLNKFTDLELAESKLNTAKEEMRQIISTNETRKSLLRGEKIQLTREIDSQKRKRETLVAQIDPSILSAYKSLYETKNGVAVAFLQENSCSSCGASLTASQCQQARSPGKITYCPSCGRILYGS